jgi:hypothetical protein
MLGEALARRAKADRGNARHQAGCGGCESDRRFLVHRHERSAIEAAGIQPIQPRSSRLPPATPEDLAKYIREAHNGSPVSCSDSAASPISLTRRR